MVTIEEDIGESGGFWSILDYFLSFLLSFILSDNYGDQMQMNVLRILQV